MLRDIPRYHCTTEGAVAHLDGECVGFDDHCDQLSAVAQEREIPRLCAEEARASADRLTAENAALRVALESRSNTAVSRQLRAVLRLAATVAQNNAYYDPQAGTVTVVPTDSGRELRALAVAFRRLRVAEAAMTEGGTRATDAAQKPTPSNAPGQ